MASRHERRSSWSRAAWGFVIGALLSFPLLLAHEIIALALSTMSIAEGAFGALARVAPGPLVTRAIDAIVALVRAVGAESTAAAAKSIEHALAFALVVGASGVVGALLAVAPRVWGATVIALVTLATVGIALVDEANPLAVVLFAGSTALWGFAARHAARAPRRRAQERAGPHARADRWTRRRFVALSSGAAVVAVAAIVPVARRRRSAVGDGRAGTPLAATPRAPADTAFEVAPGTRSRITPLADFYRVDINLSPPDVDADEFRLDVGGVIDRPLSLSLDDLERMDLEEQWATLSCISNPIGGDLIGTTSFTGVQLARVLERAGAAPRARGVRFRCADGYSETLPFASAVDPRTLLVVGMGGAHLTREHGFPVRLYTPNRFGMKNPKWIVAVDVVEDDRADGYWERRGWDADAFVRTTSVIDTRSPRRTDGAVALGGIAFAGARGIERVEVRLDDGAWRPARLERTISPLTWLRWRADVDAAPGEHVVVVRAVDGEGVPQDVDRREPHPSGASGLHQLSIRV